MVVRDYIILIKQQKVQKAQGKNQCSRSGSYCPDPDQTFFPESGPGSAKKSRPDPENPDPDP